uniref:Peptidase S10 serine carboxypeptidase n=1 Tax=Lactuca sativa TaxID=4236 RepID=A0A9R1XC55_LACSA|nr:hypothetical protein LSAT_V11C400205650 [Lactuca sativa]
MIKESKMSDTGMLYYCLGIEEHQHNEGLTLKQSAYATIVLKKVGMFHCNACRYHESIHGRSTKQHQQAIKHTLSGDTDGMIPVTSSRYSVNKLKLPIETAWRPWYYNGEVGGYVVGYKGVLLTTVRGAGHAVPSYQPERALLMISSFLHGKLPPSLTK